MAGVVGLSRLPIIRYLKKTTNVLFSRYLLVTNTAITVGLGCTGDVLQQNYERVRGRQEKLDQHRTSQVFITGFVVGPTCHFWYKCLDHFWPGRSLSTVLRKVLIDQVVFSPVNIGMFLIMIGYLNGYSTPRILADLKDKGLDLLKAEWIVWPPAQLVNFLLLPTKYRVLYDNTVSLAFDSYYSYVTFSRDRHNDLKAKRRVLVLDPPEGEESVPYYEHSADELEDDIRDLGPYPSELFTYTCTTARCIPRPQCCDRKS